MTARSIAIPKGPDGRLDPERLGPAIKQGFCVARWHLDASAAS